MKDLRIFEDYNLIIGQAEDLLGSPYYYVLARNLDDGCSYVSFFPKFVQVIEYLENYYERSYDDETQS